MPKTPVTATFIRLMKDAEKKRIVQKRSQVLSAQFMKTLRTLERRAGDKWDFTEFTNHVLAALIREHSGIIARVRIEMAVHRRIMTILLRWLSEESHREARRELAALKINNIIR